MGTQKQTSPKLASKVTSTTLIKTGLVAVVAAGLLPFAPAAFAEPDTVRPVSASVSYADLDLSTEQGARAMLQRIRSTAREMCGSEPVHSPLTPRAVTQSSNCVTDAIDSAVTNLGAPLVAALNNEEAEKALTVLASVDLACTGQEALNQVLAAEGKGIPYDLLITEWKRPVMDGVECVRQLQQSAPARMPAVIMVTAYSR